MSETIEAPVRPAFANSIGGEWIPSRSGETYEKRNPARPSELVGEFPLSNAEDVEAAVAAAAQAFPSWSRTPAAKRGAVLDKAADAIEERVEEIARDMTLEMGKPLREARMEALRAAAIFRYFASQWSRPKGEIFEQSSSGSPVYTLRRPLGVVGLITPWNFPAAIPAWKTAPALAFGNAVVLKLAQDAPLTGLHLAACLEEGRLPPGVLNVVVGRGSEAGAALVGHDAVKAISFTGSVEIGRHVRDEATARGKRVQLELGGHNPLIVMADAKLDGAVEAAYAGAFWSAGQKCTATRRIFVHEPIYEEFRERLLDRIERGKVGDPSDPETEVGPIVNERQLTDVLEAIEQGTREGGTVIAGGERLDDEAYLLAPTLFENVGDDDLLSCQEVFGPVTSLYRFSRLDEAIERANAVEYGLSAAIFTTNLESAQQFVEQIGAGLIHVNSQTAGAEVHVPFGGIKGSGFGPHEQGQSALEFYTEVVTVYQDV